MASFMGIVNFVLFVDMIILAIFRFVVDLWYSASFNAVMICVYWLLSCVFVAIAPFKWLGITETLFKFMTTKYWRPCFIIIVSVSMVYWNNFDNLEWY